MLLPTLLAYFRRSLCLGEGIRKMGGYLHIVKLLVEMSTDLSGLRVLQSLSDYARQVMQCAFHFCNCGFGVNASVVGPERFNIPLVRCLDHVQIPQLLFYCLTVEATHDSIGLMLLHLRTQLYECRLALLQLFNWDGGIRELRLSPLFDRCGKFAVPRRFDEHSLAPGSFLITSLEQAFPFLLLLFREGAGMGKPAKGIIRDGIPVARIPAPVQVDSP